MNNEQRDASEALAGNVTLSSQLARLSRMSDKEFLNFVNHFDRDFVMRVLDAAEDKTLLRRYLAVMLQYYLDQNWA